ncbi:RidA family protein [Dethiosulfatarculus sandiegensis]|uniref:Endoribonuclease L-PSP n=1 Tax=Dethiosulfatarculus sandiegensis TaxID=1429043 RepID=A0A0D2JIT4_9BACT|nr:RidA family protein [Dethiosulfatarculus sandiegensis]KIX15586.1 endoribonuclease L-PSP [Dethiosulfatarculus sandiegensis]
MKEQIKTDKAPAAIGPYSQAVKSNGFVFCSGQLAINPETGKVEGDVQEQTKTLLTNMGNILAEAGSSLDKVVKTTVFLADIKDFAAVNEVYATFFKEIPPARSAFQVANLPLGGLVEIEAIAEA